MENCFGLLAARWRILLKRIEAHDVLADAIVKACCVLHNFLIEMRGVEPSMVDHGQRNEKNGLWRRAGEMRSVSVLRNSRANRARDEAVEMRNKLTDIFSGIGAVSWQNDVV